MKYNLEARAKTLKGTVTVGSREGYSGKEFEIDRVELELDNINVKLSGRGLRTIPCIITNGKLIGRSSGGSAKYAERVYRLEFSWSPRSPKMGKKEFNSILMDYATGLGCRLKQERVYIEFDGKTSVLKAR